MRSRIDSSYRFWDIKEWENWMGMGNRRVREMVCILWVELSFLGKDLLADFIERI